MIVSWANINSKNQSICRSKTNEPKRWASACHTVQTFSIQTSLYLSFFLIYFCFFFFYFSSFSLSLPTGLSLSLPRHGYRIHAYIKRAHATVLCAISGTPFVRNQHFAIWWTSHIRWTPNIFTHPKHGTQYGYHSLHGRWALGAHSKSNSKFAYDNFFSQFQCISWPEWSQLESSCAFYDFYHIYFVPILQLTSLSTYKNKQTKFKL